MTLRAKPIHLPGLNGLRAIAAMAVVISHITLGLDSFGLDSKIFGVDKLGNASGLSLAGYGVSIFFTLSGFLITFLLLKEKELSSVNVKAFYMRRLLRIWPLYYLYLGVSLLVALSLNMDIPGGSVPFYFLLMANVPFISGGMVPFVGHYWSLGVEEQFYVFFPHIAKLPNSKLFRVALLIAASLFLLKGVCWYLFRQHISELPFVAVSVTRFHVMLVGVAAAILYYDQNEKFVKATTHPIAQTGAWLVMGLIAVNKFHTASVIDNELVSLVSVVLIMGQITSKNRIINLENKFFDFLGKLSYGIYVIHPILIHLTALTIGKFQEPSLVNYLTVYIIVTAATIGLAYVSYEFYEKRFLKLKLNYTVVQSSSTREPGIELPELTLASVPSIQVQPDRSLLVAFERPEEPACSDYENSRSTLVIRRTSKSNANKQPNLYAVEEAP